MGESKRVFEEERISDDEYEQHQFVSFCESAYIKHQRKPSLIKQIINFFINLKTKIK